jgi:hypothetical protein
MKQLSPQRYFCDIFGLFIISNFIQALNIHELSTFKSILCK